VVHVQVESGLLDVKGLGAIHVRNGNHHEFKLPIHDAAPWFESVRSLLSRRVRPTACARQAGRVISLVGQPSRFNLRQPPARLLATICFSMAVRAGASIVSPFGQQRYARLSCGLGRR